MGFVVYAFPLGESDQLITCFTSAGNIVKFVAKGSRKVKSRFAASVQLFNLGEYVIYRGRGLPYLRQADIVHSFSGIRRDWTKSGAAFVIMELCRLLIGDSTGETKAFRLTLACMHYLNETHYHPLVFDAFRLQFVARLGYEMSFSHCTICAQETQTGLLEWGQGGLVCCRCSSAPSARPRVARSLLALLSTLQTGEFTQISYLKVDPSLRQSCAGAVDSLIFWLTEGKTKAQAFRRLFENGF